MLLRPGYLIALRRSSALTPPPAPPLAVTATVEGEGWVLAVRGSWGSTITGGSWRRPNGDALAANTDRMDAEWWIAGVNQFPLDPAGTPKIRINLRSAGFDRSGGQAVFNANRSRSVVATRPLRVPFISGGTQTPLDEVDHGDGTRTIRFALSDRVYSTCSISSIEFAAGWKLGQSGGLAATVVNSSTRTPCLPIFRHASESWDYVGGTAGAPVHIWRPELIIASHHPEHFGSKLHQAAAAVKWTITDGSTVFEAWVGEDAISPRYGDNLLCWTAPIDLSGSGLNPGPLTAWATVYPWVGAARTANPAPSGTAAEQHNTAQSASLATAWGAPMHLWYDPEGAIWPRRFVCIDPINGTTAAASVVTHATAAAAEAAAASTKPRTVSVAVGGFNTGTGGNQTLPARNGFPSVTICAAWWEILLPEGVSIHDASSGTGGTKAGPGYVILRGVPSSATPRVSCILRSGATSPANLAGINRIKVANARVETGQAAIFSSSLNNRWLILENVSQTGKAGFESSNASVFASVDFVSVFNTTQRNCNGQNFGALMRNVTRTAMMGVSNQIGAAINTRLVMPDAGEFAPSRGYAFNNGVSNLADTMLWNVEAYGLTLPILTAATPVFGGVGSLRWALINSVFEGTGANTELLIIGETVGSNLRDSIIEGCTFTGGRWNFHNDNDVHGTTGSNAVRTNNSPNTTIIIGILNHGLSGDGGAGSDRVTIRGVTGGNAANMNRTDVPITVLDDHRFSYTAGGAVTSAGAGAVFVDVLTGARAGQSLQVVRQDLKQIGNVIRYSAFCRNGTKHDVFNSSPFLIGSFELLFGVGYRGNTNASRGVSSPADFQYAYYGIGSESELNLVNGDLTGSPAYGVNWFGYVNDNTRHGPAGAAATFGGDYRAQSADLDDFTPSRLLNKGNGPACTAQDARGNIRGLTFDGGALGRA